MAIPSNGSPKRPGYEYRCSRCPISNWSSELAHSSRISPERSDPMAASKQGGQDVPGRQFADHLDRASEIVRSWPLWKQVVVGGILRQPESVAEPSKVIVSERIQETSAGPACTGYR